MTPGSQGRRAWVLGLALGAASMAAWAQTAPVAATREDTRSALRADQAVQTQQMDALEKACYSRFFTTNCLVDVARQRRKMMADFERKTVALDAADRQQRAQEASQRVQEKQQEQSQRLQSADPEALNEAQRNKQAEIDAKQQAHADKAAAALEPHPAKAPKAESGPSAAERAANLAAFDKKEAQAAQRMAQRETERAKAAASAASAPLALPLPMVPGK